MRVAAGLEMHMIGFLAVFSSALSGYAGIGVWAIAASALALAALSQAEYTPLYKRAREHGLTDVAQTTIVQSLLNALAASGGAYLVGMVVRFF